MRQHLHADIAHASMEIAEAGKYDDAIFAAFRIVEAAIQQRIASRSIGESLVAEAFDNDLPKINVSNDPRDRKGVRDMFSGALTNIRNDRGHKKAPATPCESMDDCLLYLAFASLLMHLLTKDRNIFPRIDNIRVLGTSQEPRAELRGVNFAGSIVSVIAGGAEATVVRKAPSVVEVLLPERFFGKLSVVSDGRRSEEAFCDASSLGGQPTPHSEVVAAELPLYSDPKATIRRSGVVGLLLKAVEPSRELLAITPTYPGRYKSGSYVSRGPFEHGTSIGESWYVDPATRAVEYAWTGSMIELPEPLGPVGELSLGGISILPKSVQTQIGENRCLRVSGWGRDGRVQKELDVTEQVAWESLDPAIAYVNKAIAIPKRLGKARIECRLEGFVDSIELTVEHLVKGQRTTYFQGLRRLQQIRFDRDDNLYICNQGPSVFRLDRSGGFSEVVRLSTNPRAAAGIDCIGIDNNSNLYVNDISKRAAYKFEWNGKVFENPVEIATTATGAKKSIAISDSGEAFIAVMGSPGQGWIVRREPAGKEESFAVKGMPIWLSIGPDNNIYVPIVASSSIVVYQRDGKIVDEVPYQAKDAGIGDFMVSRDGDIYLALFHSGRILRIGYRSPLWHAEILRHEFGTCGGLALDSRGRLYVSDFAGNKIDVVY